ncbi:MAG: N-acetylmuramoyl-L-alanine amidase [Sandaracinaceae bacterium]
MNEPTCTPRDAVCDAVYIEALKRGLSEREAHAAAEDVADRLRLPGQCDAPPEAGFYDLRDEQDYWYPGGRRKTLIRGNQVVMRAPEEVTTIVVHQTAAEYGVSRRAVEFAGGDVELARARRALDVACHAMAFRAGYFVAAHPLRTYVQHAGRFNGYSLGLEVEGRYPGLLDDPDTLPREDLLTTWGGSPSELTEETLIAAQAALTWLVDEGRREGMPIRYVVAHRQSSDNRRSDPGEEIWRRLVLEYAVDELGLEAQRESPWREGRPIPTEWDPSGLGPY